MRGRPTATRRGFTLVEVLLALGLTMLVLAAAYSGLILFQRVTVAGRDDAERSQLARAIERRIASDIRCVLFQEAEVEEEAESAAAADVQQIDESKGAADDDSGTAPAPPEETSTATEDETVPPATGVIGTATTLTLIVAKPVRESAATAPPTTTTASEPVLLRKSDLRRISYFLAAPGADGLAGTVANTAPTDPISAASGQGAQGLARVDGDRLTLEQAEADGNLELVAHQATILASEVTELRFRYYDGVEWLAEWDSAVLNALPKAVEITLRIEVDRPTEPVNAFQGAPPLSASDLYRFVVALPLADPALGLEL